MGDSSSEFNNLFLARLLHSTIETPCARGRIMKCPKCGYQRQARDQVFIPAAECPACGIVYAKYSLVDPAASAPPEAGAAREKNTSPVDEASLRQARDRVDIRLRNQEGTRLRDDRRAQTLERARHFTAEAIRQRQEAWQRRQNQTGDTAVADAPGPEADRQTASPPEQPSMAITQGPAGDSGAGRAVEHGTAIEADGDETPENDFDALDTLSPATARGSRAKNPVRLLPLLLPAVSWLILCAGVTGAVLSWTTIGDVQAGAAGDPSNGPTGMPVALLLGFAYLATGVLGFAFFWVVSMISGQLKDIRWLLLARIAQSTAPDDGA
jgi:hypothetical protein